MRSLKVEYYSKGKKMWRAWFRWVRGVGGECDQISRAKVGKVSGAKDSESQPQRASLCQICRKICSPDHTRYKYDRHCYQVTLECVKRRPKGTHSAQLRLNVLALRVMLISSSVGMSTSITLGVTRMFVFIERNQNNRRAE